MCRVLEVSTSGYYAWRKCTPSARAQDDKMLLEEIRTSHTASYGACGASRIHKDLEEEGIRVGRKRIARLMLADGLQGVSRRKGVTTTQRRADVEAAPDLVDRVFSAERPNALWVADITYVPTKVGFLYSL